MTGNNHLKIGIQSLDYFDFLAQGFVQLWIENFAGQKPLGVGGDKRLLVASLYYR